VLKRVFVIGCGGFLALVVLGVIAVVVVLRTHRLHKLSAPEKPIEAVAGNYSAHLSFGGRNRHYIVHVPPGVQAGAKVPVVFALHGGGGSASTTDDLMKLTPVSDKEGFIVVFPDGVGHGWNDGRPDAGTDAVDNKVDDVGFLRALVDEVSRVLPVDRQRVYATGISNGAMMSGWLACNAADVFAAVALVAGTGPAALGSLCRPSRPVSVLAFNGTEDPLVKYNGGTVPNLLPWRNNGRTIAVAGLRGFWVANDRCQGQPTTQQLPDLDTGDGSRVTVETWDRCAAGSSITFYRIDGGGHTWPGGRQYLPERLVGHTNRDLNASEVIWRFFAEHTLQ